MIDLKQIYKNKDIPEVDSAMIEEAEKIAKSDDVSFEDALLYLLDMIVEKPFE